MSSPRLHIAMVAPALPPMLDGIGDYSAHLAAELAREARVTVLAPKGQDYAPIHDVEIVPAYSIQPRSGVLAITEHVREARPDWLLLQYNPFGYGRRGLNLSLPNVLWSIRKNCSKTRIAVMVHEAYMPISNWRFAVMTTWHRWQFWQIGRAAHELFFSISPWAERYRRWFPGKPVNHLPVGSNVPRVKIDRQEARRRLGITDDQIVLGVFGTAHESRLFGHVRAAFDAVAARGARPLVIYMGPHGTTVRTALGDRPSICQGPLEADEISRRLAAVDIYLAPYEKGVSTRRGAMMAGLQHRLPTVSTRGAHTDRILLEADRQAILLSDDADADGFAENVLKLLDDTALRQRIAAGGRELYEASFDWPVIAGKLLNRLSSHKESPRENRLARAGT